MPGKTVGEIEGEMIAWCTQPGHGTRIFPDGTITGVQFTKSPDYVQVVGFMKQTDMNMIAGDSGGEMDPHGADLVSLSCALHSLLADGGSCREGILLEVFCSQTLSQEHMSRRLNGTSKSRNMTLYLLFL